MEIKHAEFISSHDKVEKAPQPDKPEFAFIGRSNVGKSSLINMLTGRKNLAKTSGTPGKTQTINHFLINQTWYLVDLPGYGYAKISRDKREGFGKMIEQYILKRENLYCLFILLDMRLEPQKIDLEFIQWCGSKEIPLCLAFTKADKLTRNQLNKNIAVYQSTLKQTWSELPAMIITSATEKTGRDEVLLFIENALADAT
ncbi:MAG TPA: ribosome biogenesis GTP-binding protein YihA/YsxC [Chryseosolibacter sp.]|nr:ribosome biogenesis GTP-binding protein YihA/YsxC [Chryseosolibacter sp.]